MIEKPSFHDVVAWLRASLLKGTPRPHATAQGLSPDRRAELDAAARVERLERASVAPGEHPAPMHLDILDLLDEAAGLDLSGSNPDAVQALAAWEGRALSALGLMADGQLLDALCPWCGGRTERAPLGGERTLRVRLIVDRKARESKLAAIVCEGLNCDPSSSDASEDERWRGRPTWLQGDWEWLAARITHADGMRGLEAQQLAAQTARETPTRCPCGQRVESTGRGGQQPLYCSERCRLNAKAERQRRSRSSAA